MSKLIKRSGAAKGMRLTSATRRVMNALPLLAVDDAGSVEDVGRLDADAGTEAGTRDPGSGTMDMEARLRDEFKAGFDEGRRFAEKQLRESFAVQLHETQEAIRVLTENMQREYDELYASAERNVVRLALAVAERIVKRQVLLDDEFVIRQICEGAKRVIGVERIRIRVNPADEEYVRQHRAQILMNADSVRDLVIESDETIERGSCVMESDAGNVDALIATQLERIEAALFGEAEK